MSYLGLRRNSFRDFETAYLNLYELASFVHRYKCKRRRSTQKISYIYLSPIWNSESGPDTAKKQLNMENKSLVLKVLLVTVLPSALTRDFLLGKSSGSSCYHQVNCTLRDGSISRVLWDANTTDDWKGWKATGKLPRVVLWGNRSCNFKSTLRFVIWYIFKFLRLGWVKFHVKMSGMLVGKIWVKPIKETNLGVAWLFDS